jgi:type VI secretion system protein
MREQRLLERIRLWDKEPDRRSREDTGRVIDSVLLHLQRILNTKEGSVPIAEDFGLPDFTDLIDNYPESIKDLERSIRKMVLKYEPRLRAVQVKFIPQEEATLSLDFQITAELETQDEKVPVVFESQMESSGKMKVKG